MHQSEYQKLKLKKKFICGFLYGLGFLFIFLEWIKEPFFLDQETESFFLISYLLIIYCSIFFGIIFLIFDYFKNFFLKLLIFPLLIVLVEYLIGHIGYGFPWISFSLIHSGNLFGPALIYYVGTYGLSYITVLLFLFPLIFLYAHSKLQKSLKFFYFLIFISIFLLVFLRITNQLNHQNKLSEKNIDITMAQMNFPVNQKLDHSGLKSKHNFIVNNILKNESDLIIFGENNFPFIVNDLYELEYLQSFIGQKSNLIIGATREGINKIKTDQANYYNSFLFLNSEKITKFDKKILVPFGEFIPLRSLFKFMETIAGSSDFVAGNGTRYIKITDELSIMPIICYEILYFWRLINTLNVNSDLIINLTNDSWFGKYTGPYQHFYFSRLRAAEFNKVLVRVSNNGVSAIINNYGTIIDFIPLNQQKIKKTTIRINKQNENYLRIHKYFIFIVFMFVILCSFFNKKNDFK